MLASVAFGGIYYHWTQDHARIHKLYGVAFYVLAGYTLYYSLGTSGATNQSGDAVEKTLGVLRGFINLALYASPLETTKKIIETKDASTIPINISAIFLGDGSFWVLHSIAEEDILVLVPNALGLALCVVQIGAVRGVLSSLNNNDCADKLHELRSRNFYNVRDDGA